MGVQEHEDAIELAVERWNAHDDRYFELYEASAPIHGLPPQVPATVEGMKELFHQMWGAFPDMRLDVLSMVAEGGAVAVHLRVAGTHEGEFLGAAPTGKGVEFTSMTFFRFGPQGKVVERWTRIDEVALLTQLGLMPAPAGAPA
jgi:predicted ester cyclase